MENLKCPSDESYLIGNENCLLTEHVGTNK